MGRPQWLQVGSQTRSSECSWCRQPQRRSLPTGACRGGNARSRETRGSSASCISFLPEGNLEHCKEKDQSKKLYAKFCLSFQEKRCRTFCKFVFFSFILCVSSHVSSKCSCFSSRFLSLLLLLLASGIH